MNVPLFDLHRVLKKHNKDLVSAFAACTDHGKFILGPDVRAFEEAFSEKMNAKYCIGTSSGTDALLAILMALNLDPGSEIIVPSFTFIASASTILRAGLKPIFVDLERDSFQASLRTIKQVWSDKTKGVMFVHLFGETTDLSEIKQFCDDNDAVLIEDCAQSYGSSAGTQGIAGAFSFFPAKNLGCLGDGGAIITNDDKLFDKLEMVRAHGSREKYSYELLGGNFRLDTIQAAFLNVLLPRSDEWIAKRKDNAVYYNEHLCGLDDIIIPRMTNDHSWNQYTLRTSKRDQFKEYLDINNIGNAIYYPHPLHKSRIFGFNRTLEETEKRCKEVISIPICPGLLSEEREYIVDKIRSFK